MAEEHPVGLEVTPVEGSIWAIVVPTSCRACGSVRGNYCIGADGKKMPAAVHTQRWVDHHSSDSSK